jgi:hypothetical protein
MTRKTCKIPMKELKGHTYQKEKKMEARVRMQQQKSA